MNRVEYVSWRYQPNGYYKTYEVPTGETKKGLLGKEKEVKKEVQEWVWDGYKDYRVTLEEFMQDVEQKVSELNKEGYEIISVVPITLGSTYYDYKERSFPQGGLGYGYGYGYGYTAGITIFARKVGQS